MALMSSNYDQTETEVSRRREQDTSMNKTNQK